jgi:hypothetical protein
MTTTATGALVLLAPPDSAIERRRTLRVSAVALSLKVSQPREAEVNLWGQKIVTLTMI